MSVRNEEEREFFVPVDTHKQTGFEYAVVAEISHSKVPRRKGKLHQQQNGTFQSKELESGVVQPGKSKRGPGREKGHNYGRAQDGDRQVSSSTGTAHSSQQASVLASVYNQQMNMHPPRHLSTDATTGTTQYFKASQSRPYPNATGPGSFRHPLANYQFDPGTARMTGGSSSASSPQYLPSYYPPPVHYPPPGFLHPSMYSADRMNNNVHKRNSPAKGDGSSGVNIVKSRLLDQDMIQGSVEPVPTENSVDSPTHKSQSKVSEQVIQPRVLRATDL